MAPATTSELTPDQLADVAMLVVAVYSNMTGFLRAAQPLAVSLEGFGLSELGEQLLADCRTLANTMGEIGNLTARIANQQIAAANQPVEG